MDNSSPSPRTLPRKDVSRERGVSTPDSIDLNDNVPGLPSDDKRPIFNKISLSEGAFPRRTSVQFTPYVRGDGGDRSLSRNPTRDSRRLSSPPPPALFKPRVSFDTFDNRDASDFSLTLSRKHRDYAYSKRSRTFLCGTDINEYSDTALEWLIDELIDDGDEIVCLRVVEKDSKEARDWAGQVPGKENRERGYRAEAQRMLERILEKNTDDRAINLVLEFTIGKVHDTIQHMIRIYEPAMLVVGTKGRSLSGFQGLMPGSVSKYCLQHSPVPVIVVRPSSKRAKKKKKRLKDPSRRGYRDILDKSEDVAEGGHLLDERNRHSVIGTNVLSELGVRDAEEEARMVAEAIGYRMGGRASPDGGPLTKTISGRSEVSTRSARSASMGSYGSEGDDPRSPAFKQLMKSPELANLDSPIGSDEDSSDDDGYHAVPAYVLAQEEALNKARERAIKAEEEEREGELERIKRDNEIRAMRERRERMTQGAGGKNSPDVSGQGAAAVLGLLDDLQAQEKTTKRAK